MQEFAVGFRRVTGSDDLVVELLVHVVGLVGQGGLAHSTACYVVIINDRLFQGRLLSTVDFEGDGLSEGGALAPAVLLVLLVVLLLHNGVGRAVRVYEDSQVSFAVYHAQR